MQHVCLITGPSDSAVGVVGVVHEQWVQPYSLQQQLCQLPVLAIYAGLAWFAFRC